MIRRLFTVAFVPPLLLWLAILPLVSSLSCQPNNPAASPTLATEAIAPTSRATRTKEAPWNGPRPPDLQYRRQVAAAQREGHWPPMKARRYSVYTFEDGRWLPISTVDSFDSADALRNAIEVIPEDYYGQPIAVLPDDVRVLPPLNGIPQTQPSP